MIRIEPLLLLAALSACALGRDCGPDAVGIKRLKCDASAGDKQAQLELGIRYETGEGVPRDVGRAAELYSRAARSEQRPRHVYSPPVGKERHGRILTSGPVSVSPGLPEARRRLEGLQGRGAEVDRASVQPPPTRVQGGEAAPVEEAPKRVSRPTSSVEETSAASETVTTGAELDQTWQRLMGGLLRPMLALSSTDVAIIFGIEPGQAGAAPFPTTAWRSFIAPPGAGGELQRVQFARRRVPCDPRICQQESMIQLLVIPVWRTAASDDLPPSGTEPACTTNMDLADRLPAAGWTPAQAEQKSSVRSAHPPRYMPNSFTRPAERILIEPSVTEGRRCVTLITIERQVDD